MKQKPEHIAAEKIAFTDNGILKNLLGEHDRNIKLIERLERVKIGIRGNDLSVSGDSLAVVLVKRLSFFGE